MNMKEQRAEAMDEISNGTAEAEYRFNGGSARANRHERRTPCGNCPFRKDAPLAHWEPREYVMLADIERREGDFFGGSSFGRHKDRALPEDERGACVGWLLDQRRRNIPSIRLRLMMASSDDLSAQVAEAEPDGPLWGSVSELVRANLEEDARRHPDRYEAAKLRSSGGEG